MPSAASTRRTTTETSDGWHHESVPSPSPSTSQLPANEPSPSSKGFCECTELDPEPIAQASGGTELGPVLKVYLRDHDSELNSDEVILIRHPRSYTLQTKLNRDGEPGRPPNSFIVFRALVSKVFTINVGSVEDINLWFKDTAPESAKSSSSDAKEVKESQDDGKGEKKRLGVGQFQIIAKGRIATSLWDHVKSHHPRIHAMFVKRQNELEAEHRLMFPDYTFNPRQKAKEPNPKRKRSKTDQQAEEPNSRRRTNSHSQYPVAPMALHAPPGFSPANFGPPVYRYPPPSPSRSPSPESPPPYHTARPDDHSKSQYSFSGDGSHARVVAPPSIYYSMRPVLYQEAAPTSEPPRISRLSWSSRTTNTDEETTSQEATPPKDLDAMTPRKDIESSRAYSEGGVTRPLSSVRGSSFTFDPSAQTPPTPSSDNGTEDSDGHIMGSLQA
ncbi:hypothetical protein DFP72DRAFT_875933 [Ephemerocybe angulata]|uniref:Uncharacterized protein n=1 Tax=Ephemerocybe angulata TaxID=980116 RepID=A0A8H6MAX5_9AGAR|nr:hypothetical protein DFP72DRAFT_875933 [Tulosesus angulatus]